MTKPSVLEALHLWVDEPDDSRFMSDHQFSVVVAETGRNRSGEVVAVAVAVAAPQDGPLRVSQFRLKGPFEKPKEVRRQWLRRRFSRSPQKRRRRPGGPALGGEVASPRRAFPGPDFKF